jgi:hypothetical protein
MRDVSARIGANDHGKLWVNGRVVVTKNEAGALVKDAASGKTSLKKGLNVVVFKVVNAGDNWSGCVRFTDKAGAPIKDLEIRTTPPLTPEELAAVD